MPGSEQSSERWQSPSAQPVRRYDRRVAEHLEPTATPSLDSWIAEAGEPAVMAAVNALNGVIDEGTVPLLRDAASLQAYWDSRRHQTA